MALLKRLWIAMRTQDTGGSGTDDRIVLIVNEDGVDKLHHTFPDTDQEDQEGGLANLYDVAVGDRNIRSEKLTNSSIRVGIRGSDFWHPQHVMVWGEQAEGGLVSPLAIEVDMEEGISTDSSEGNTSLPLRRLGLLGADARLRQLLILTTTANVKGTGSDNELEVVLTFAGGRRIWNQGGFKPPKRAQAEFILPPQFGFPGEPQPRRSNLDSVVLKIAGDDPWIPASFFLFAMEHGFTEGFNGPRPEAIMPLVHIPKWSLGTLSTDPGKGQESVVLPLVPTPILPPIFDIDVNVRFSTP